MTVAELIAKLQELPQDAKVVRGDTDWGGVEVREARAGVFYSAHSINSGAYWENEYPEMPRDEDETPNEDLVIIR